MLYLFVWLKERNSKYYDNLNSMDAGIFHKISDARLVVKKLVLKSMNDD